MTRKNVNEQTILNDGIQFWKGYLEAILWVKDNMALSSEDLERLEKQLKFSSGEFSSMKESYDSNLRRKRNARYSK